MYTKPELTKHISILTTEKISEIQGLDENSEEKNISHCFSTKLAKKEKKKNHLLFQTRLVNAGWSQVVQWVGSGRRESLFVREGSAEPPLAEPGEAAATHSRNRNGCSVLGVGRLLTVRRWDGAAE